MVREGEPPQVYCIGTDSTNQAVKAISISRRNLSEDNLDLLVQPRFQKAEDIGDMDSYIFALRKGPHREQVPATEKMKIASAGDAGVIAGAIAAKLREGERICMQGIGANAVNVMVKSVVHSGSICLMKIWMLVFDHSSRNTKLTVKKQLASVSIFLQCKHKSTLYLRRFY